jgi:urease accessory protein
MRAVSILPAGAWDAAKARDSVTLDHDRRRRRRLMLRTDTGADCLLDLKATVHLRDGDGLLGEDGAIIRVIAAPEPLAEITADDPALLIRLAWHLGNRHLDVAFAGNALRIRADHVIEAMAEGLGGHVGHLSAPFDPESGAYAHD